MSVVGCGRQGRRNHGGRDLRSGVLLFFVAVVSVGRGFCPVTEPHPKGWARGYLGVVHSADCPVDGMSRRRFRRTRPGQGMGRATIDGAAGKQTDERARSSGRRQRVSAGHGPAWAGTGRHGTAPASHLRSLGLISASAEVYLRSVGLVRT